MPREERDQLEKAGTKRTILEINDALAEFTRTGTLFVSAPKPTPGRPALLPHAAVALESPNPVL